MGHAANTRANPICLLLKVIFTHSGGLSDVIQTSSSLLLCPLHHLAGEMVSSAVAQEAVNQVLSRIKDGCQHKSDAKEHIERMEMAHIKLEAALETSNKWNVTSAPLLRWPGPSHREGQFPVRPLLDLDAADAGPKTVTWCRQRLQEEEEVQQVLRSSSFPKRIAHTARSFVSLIFSHGKDDELTGSTATRRFERFAEGASEFLRYVELGGTPCRYMFFDPLIRHLLTGKGTKYCFVSKGQHLSFLLQPFSPLQEHGMEGNLIFLLEDANAPENNFLFTLQLRLSESTDIVGVAVRCLNLFTPHLRSTTETVKTKLTQLGDIMIPKAVDCLRRDAAATSYQIMWKSKHGRAYLQFGKTTWRATAQEDRGRKHHKRLPGKKVLGWASANNEFICSWIRHAPVQLQSSVVDWIQKGRQLPQPLLLKTSCFHDCPIMLFSLKDHISLVTTIKSSSKFNG
ncbi:unnamed protein product [Miscanthus lutarioriparius]|uniref:Uncharacterized protein n=1 Tax=Miscanthus lutarioriparius TaxID=422564 RepID=A0A811QI82_9POAL|nr:unnamed protein product [Miscanthus lutarioriparius]